SDPCKFIPLHICKAEGMGTRTIVVPLSKKFCYLKPSGIFLAILEFLEAPKNFSKFQKLPKIEKN
ncbi:hypothetical protein AAAB34_13970, partial [Lacticaseibacillus casei]|uniref:hypothetical protein n=1 Tax=Lacticaseibacillus casei TaxID=1582 RepID=UPI0030F17DDF